MKKHVYQEGFPGGSDARNLPHAGDPGSISPCPPAGDPWVGKMLEWIAIDRGAVAPVNRVTQNLT